jgi:esterase/lipase superfamily enzyme
METLRLAAAGALGQIGPGAKAAGPKLTQVLERDNESVELHIAAAQSLAQIAPTAATATILIKQAQKTDDLEFAGQMATSLASLGEIASAAVPLLTTLVEKSSADNEDVCVRAIEALGQIGSPAKSATPALIQLLTNPEIEETIHVAAAAAIGKLGPPAVSALADHLDKSEAETDLTIARALAAIGPQAAPAVDKLLAALASDDQDNDIRILAAIALGNCGPAAQSALPALTRLLNDGEADAQLRAMCAVAIGSIEPTTAEPLLKKVLNDTSTSVQVAAAYSLSKISPSNRQASIQQLVDLLAQEEARDLAARAIVEIGKDAISPLAASAKIEQHELAWRLACIDVLGEIGNDAVPELIAAINDAALAESACGGLCNIGQSTVPALLIAADNEARFNPAARENIRQLIRDLHDGLGAGDGDSAWGQAHPLARLSKDEIPRQMIQLQPLAVMGTEIPDSGIIPPGKERLDSGLGNRAAPPSSEAPPPPPPAENVGYKSVKVFYGTNRQPLTTVALPSIRWFSFQTVAIVALAICLGCLLWQQPRSLFAVSACAIGLAVLTVPTVPFYQYQPSSLFDSSSVEYGGEYSDRVEMGVCEVTIPDSHEVGELEGPSILNFELTIDPEKHIVLRSTQRLAGDAFFEELDGEMVRQGRNVLVFIHGYNVSFADAARRTAQMTSDLKYPGAAVFYSWPSQANWYKYRLDEKNVELSVGQLKSFLLEVAARSNATTINLVAHSMGNRALTSALKEIDATARGNDILFNQVVLAAPDIDATIFKERIAPSIVTKARRITLYASSKDLALFASRQFNSGDARAGDAGDDIVVVSGVETIDASASDSSLLGHCYYGSSVSVLRDIEHLLKNQPPQNRPFLHPRAHQGMTYWIFHPEELASQPGNTSDLR